ncbi:MAG: gamma-glutamyltransferase [Myxococcales bacterium]|nr:gamma-glutamyltransferase [Myxococcales bacterium]
MRNLLVSSNAIAQAAGTEAISQGGNAVDGVLAALLAGAAVSSPASLLGSAVITVAGLGVGAYAVDGRAKATGLATARRSAPEDPPVRDAIASPGLVEGVLTAHNRFGSLALSRVARAAMDAIKEHSEDPHAKARMPVLEAIHRHGGRWLASLGLDQALVEAAGTPVHGPLTREDLAHNHAPVVELASRALGSHQALVFPPAIVQRFAPPEPPKTAVGVALAGDMHGVFASASWAVAPEACLLVSDYALSGAALNNAPTKGVTRRAPGTKIPLPDVAAILRHDAKVWAAAAVGGEGSLESARDELVARRVSAVTAKPIATESPAESVRATTFWLVREAGDELRSVEESVSR